MAPRRRLHRATWLAGAVLAGASPAHAAPAWSAGLDLHGTDAAVAAHRPIGVAGGLRFGAVQAAAVVDPMVLFLGWEMLDVSAGRWFGGDRVEVLGGWRQTSGRFRGGRRYDEALLLGLDSVARASHWYRLSFGAELATSLWRHGAHIPGDTIDLSLNAELATRMELVLHVRFELTGLP